MFLLCVINYVNQLSDDTDFHVQLGILNKQNKKYLKDIRSAWKIEEYFNTYWYNLDNCGALNDKATQISGMYDHLDHMCFVSLG